MSNVQDNTNMNLREVQGLVNKQMDVEYEGGEKEESKDKKKKSNQTN